MSENNRGHLSVSLGIPGLDDEKCSECGFLKSNEGTRWKIGVIPSFDYGTLMDRLYLSSQAPFDKSLPLSDESLVEIASSTTSANFNSYLDKLRLYGYTEDYSLTRDGNEFALFTDGEHNVYTYFTKNTKEVRIILDRTGELISTFGYTYEKQPGERTVVYQYGIPMSPDGVNNTENKINCGMMYVIKLADNKLIVIDGGGYQQFDTNEIDGLMAFMREITGKTSGKIDVAAWYITHCHSDHGAGFCLFLKKYGSSINLERLIWNFPSVYTEDGILSGHKGNYQKIIGYIQNYVNPNVKYLKIHNGETVTLCDLTINCIYTHEDLVDPKTGYTKINADFNNSSTLSRFDFDGLRFMLLGDINQPGQNRAVAINSDSVFLSDIVQMAHHVYNNVQTLYNKIRATAVFVPQSPKGSVKNSTMKNTMNYATQYVTDKTNLIKYGSEGTYGYAAGADGKPELVYSRNGVDGGGHTGWSW
jgi:glyoxylase-like metal-dependent hydrolase (beta-lactamase superfamily II)